MPYVVALLSGVIFYCGFSYMDPGWQRGTFAVTAGLAAYYRYRFAEAS